MSDLIITPSSGKIDFIYQSGQEISRLESITIDPTEGLVFSGKISASSVNSPLNITATSSNINYPFIFASSGTTGAKSLLMDSVGGTYNPSTNLATIDISGTSSWATNAVTNANLTGDVTSVGNATTIANSVVTNAKLANSSVTIGSTAISLGATASTIAGLTSVTSTTFVGALTGTAITASYANALNPANSYTVTGITGALTGTSSWATNALTATNATQLNGQAASYYTNIPARLGYTPVDKAGDTVTGNLIINGNFSVNGSFTAFSASNVYISSSQLYIEDNILTLNAFSPYLRYAGVEMYDSGSGTLSSLLWDGEADYFFLTGSSVNGKIITGPDGQTNLTANYIPKATAGYKLGNSLIYDDGTNVGIGTTSPTYKLNVVTTAVSGRQTLTNIDKTAQNLITFTNPQYSVLSSMGLMLRVYPQSDSRQGAGILASGGAFNGDTDLDLFVSSGSAASTTFSALKINARGSVGIGTTDPITKLDVRSGYITAGTGVSTSGTTIIGGYYSDGNLTILGTEYSSGGPMLGYGVTPSTTSAGAFLSSTGINVYRSAYTQDGGSHRWFTGAVQTVAIGSAVSTSEKMRLDSNGNVGIGITNPSFKLHTAGAGFIGRQNSYGTYDAADADLIISNYNSDNTSILLFNSAGAYNSSLINYYNNILSLGLNNDNSSNLILTSTSINITATGVGIGTTTVSSNLHIYSLTGPELRLSAGGTGTGGLRFIKGDSGESYINNQDSYAIRFQIAGSTRMSILADSSVGIGTTVPVARLQVNSTTSGATLLRTDGTNGTLFSVVDDLSDSLMSVNNSAGLPVLEVFADDRIVMGQYGQNDFVLVNNKVGIGTNNPANKLTVSGSVSIGESYINTTAPSNGLAVQGNVGIGTTSPGQKLEVATTTSNTRVRINSTEVVATEYFRSGTGVWLVGSDSSNSFKIARASNFGTNDYLSINSATADVTFFDTALGARMTLNGTGLGIGTTLPAAKLHVQGNISGSSFTSSISNAVGFLGTSSWATNATTATTVTTNANLTGHITSTGNATLLGSFTSAQLLAALTDETGTGASVFANSPTLVSPALGTPSSGVLTNCTGTAAGLSIGGTAATATNSTQLGGVAAASYVTLTDTQSLTNKTLTSPILVTPALGTPSSGNLTSCTFPTLNQNTSGTAATASYANALNAANNYTVVGITGSLFGTSSWATNAVTALNGGVTSITTNTGLSTNALATGAVTITNTGVTSAVAGTGVSVSAATGPITFSIGQAVGTAATPTFASVSATTFTGALTGTATTASYANTLNPANIYTGLNFLATGYLQSGNGQIRSDTAMALLTTGGQAQIVSTKGILLGTSYDTNPSANEIRTTNNTSLYLNARGTGDIQFQTADSLKMMLLNNGNVGIGTTSPGTLLQVHGNNPFVRISNSASSDQGIKITYGTSETHGLHLLYNANSALSYIDNTYPIDAAQVWGDILFRQNVASTMTTRMIIKGNSGNVGIGTTAPGALLNIRASAPTTTGGVTTGTNLLIDSNTSNYITFRNTADNGTYAGLVFLDNNVGGYITFRNYSGNVDTGSDCMIYGTYQDHIFQNGSSETINGKIETMRIKQNGYVGINTNNPTARLQVVQGNSGGVAAILLSSDESTIQGPSANTQIRMGGNLVLAASGIIPIVTNGSERMRIDVNGNVGIGTSTLTTKFNVYDASSGNADEVFLGTIGADQLVGGRTGGSFGIATKSASNGNLIFTANNGMYFRTSGSNDRMFIKNDGNVGVGTIIPKFALHINGDVTIPNARYLNFNTGELQGTSMTKALVVSYSDDTATSQPKQLGIILHNNSNTDDTFSPALVFGSKSNSSNYSQATAVIAGRRRSLVVDANWHAGELWFWTATSNDVGGVTVGIPTAVPAMVINSIRNVGIGTTSPSARLHVFDTNNSPATGNLLVTSTGGNASIRIDSNSTANYTYFTLSQGGVGKIEMGIVPTSSDFYINPTVQSGASGAAIYIKKADGNVGIGTTSPSGKLHVNSTTAGATLLRTDGTNGTLFSVVDDLSDSLMSVNNSAGLPVLEVFADDRIVAGQYGQNDFVVVNNKVGIGTNNPLAELHVTSSTSIPSAIFMGGNVGIGLTLPTAPLHVVGVISGSSFTGAGTGLTGTAANLSIGGTATNITAYTINQSVGTANTPSFAGVISSAVTGYAYLQVVDTNNFWITPGNTNWGLYFETSAGGLLGGTGDSNRLGFVGSGAARFYVDLNNGNGWFGGTLTSVGNISGANLSGTNTGDQSIGNGTITIAASTGVSVGATNTFTTNQSGATTVTITNTGVTALTTNTGLSTNASATGAVTITNTGVTNISAGTGIGTSASTGAVTITNNGVTSALAGTGVGVSGATGAVTFSIGQAVGTANSPTFAGLTLSPSATSQFQLNSPSATQGLWIRSGYDTDGTSTPVASANNIEIQSSGATSGTFSFVCGNTKILTIAPGAVNSLVALQQSGNQVLHAGNYNSYSPTLTGTGASGTWAINVTGNAATATTASYSLNTTLTTAATYPITSSWATNAVTATNGGVTSISSGVGIGTSAGTGAVTITNTSPNATHTGDVTGATALTIANDAVTTIKILNANVTNAKLANSSVTIGSTAVSLGAAVTTFAGLASVTSTAFVGALTGNASTATALTSMNISQFTNNSGYLTSVTNISGNAATATTAAACTGNSATATTATNVGVGSGNTSAAWYPIVWHSGNTLSSSTGTIIYAAGNYIQASYFNSSDDDTSGITRFVVKNGDGYHRSATTTLAADTIRGVASGTWSITAATANALTTGNTYQVANLGIGVAASNRLHVDGGSPAAGTAGIRIDNAGYVTGVASNNKATFYGYLPLKVSATVTVYIRLWQ